MLPHSWLKGVLVSCPQGSTYLKVPLVCDEIELIQVPANKKRAVPVRDNPLHS
jgi:hypothetical protein